MICQKILIVEDDAALADLMAWNFESQGFSVRKTPSGAEALIMVREEAPDLIILDWMIEELPGIEVCRQLRRMEATTNIPVVMLTARNNEEDRVRGLETGADDFVTKPFSPREIVARVRAIARRAGMAPQAQPSLLVFDRVEIDEAAREVRVDGADVGLKPREFALLLELASNAGIALSRSTLLARVWGFDFDGDERTVDVHIRRLRVKLQERPGRTPLLHTVQGFGYKFARG